jgi:hypothetical protein
MNPLFVDIFQNMKKINHKIQRVHPDILCSHISFRHKRIFFVLCVKSQISMLILDYREDFFVSLCRPHEMFLLSKNCECRMPECTPKLCFVFLSISTLYFYACCMIGSYAPRCKNATPNNQNKDITML